MGTGDEEAGSSREGSEGSSAISISFPPPGEGDPQRARGPDVLAPYCFRAPAPGAHSPSGFTGLCPSLILRAAALGQTCVKSPQSILKELVSRRNHSSI